jgi:acetylglutamate kinase
VDYGYVGDVKEVDAHILADLIRKNVVPVLAPLTHDKAGNMLNTNADTIAGEAARALSQYFDVKLMYCFEKKGVLKDEKDENSVIATLTPALFEEYVQSGIIQGGMIPKLENAFDALKAGVKQVMITRADLIDKESGTIVMI